MQRREFLGFAGAGIAFAASGCAETGRIAAGEGDLSEDRAVGVEHYQEDLVRKAFLYGYGPYEFARTEIATLERGRQTNTLGHRTEMTTPRHRAVTAPNLDTLYSSAFLDLSGGAMEVTTPEAPERYHCVTFMNVFTDNFGILGTRTTGGRRVKAWIVGPEWQGEVPDGVRLIRSDTNDVWMLGRILVAGLEDLDAARAVQSQFSLKPVEGHGPARPMLSKAAPVPDAQMFLGVVNEILGRSPLNLGQARRAVQFENVGIRPGNSNAWPLLSDQLKQIWTNSFPKLFEDLKAGANELLIRKQGWLAAPRDVGDFHENDALRASVALWGLAALPFEEAGYFRAVSDGAGKKLDGTRAYTFRLPAEGVPADAFWSLTMYQQEPDGRDFLVENPINRYSISDRTPGLIRNADGSLEVYIQPDTPTDALAAANWLPTPRGPFTMSFRAYLPRKEIVDGLWSPPPIEPSAPL
jgi:hypothetical protein